MISRLRHSWPVVLVLVLSMSYWATVNLLGKPNNPPGADLEGTNPAQWRLIWKDDPSTRATVSWSTAQAGREHVVYYDTESRSGKLAKYAFQQKAQRNGPYSGSGSPPISFHHTLLSGLKPNTIYYLVISSDGRISPEFHFRTASREDVPAKLIYGGDSRSDRQARREVNRRIRKLANQDEQALAFAHGGDYIASGRSWSQWSAWLTDWELTVGPGNRLLPIVPARGNHDKGPLFNEVFDFPAEDQNYYALDLTPQIRLINLNTNISHGGDQRTWLAEELSSSRSKHRWLVVNYHRPAFPAVKASGAALQHWVPLFEKYHVDLVLESDGHTIKRTAPIRNGKIDPTGVRYLGEGGLGVPQRRPDGSRWYFQGDGKVGRGHHVQVLHFAQESLQAETILLSGQTFDSVTLKPRQDQHIPTD